MQTHKGQTDRQAGRHTQTQNFKGHHPASHPSIYSASIFVQLLPVLLAMGVGWVGWLVGCGRSSWYGWVISNRNVLLTALEKGEECIYSSTIYTQIAKGIYIVHMSYLHYYQQQQLLQQLQKQQEEERLTTTATSVYQI